MTRWLRIVEVVLLATAIVFLWVDWRARQLDSARLERLEQRIDGWAGVQAVPTAVSADAAMEREAIAQRVAELIRISSPQSAPIACPNDSNRRPDSAPVEDPDDERLSADAAAKAHEAELIVAASLSSGKLRVGDVIRLRTLELASKGHPDFATMRTRIITAVNDQKLAPEDMAFVAF